MIQIANEAERLSSDEVFYWKRHFKSLLKIGTELEFISQSMDTATIKRNITDTFGLSNKYSQFGKSGIAMITGDGSLGSMGLEIKMSGRRINFFDWYVQYYQLCSDLITYTARVNYKCGFHNHILLDHGEGYNGLEKPIPGIILKNFFQLFRMHLPELIWMTSTCKATDRSNTITRGGYYCNHSQLLSTTPVNKTTQNYLETFRSHYEALSTTDMIYDGPESIKVLHFENRTPDGSIYPLQISTMACVYAAIMHYAIKLSEFGLISTGTTDEWRNTKTHTEYIRDIDSGGSDTANALSEVAMQTIKERGVAMLADLKPYLDGIDGKLFYFANMLNENPISIRRRTESDAQILSSDHELVSSVKYGEKKFEYLEKAITLGSVEQNTIENWIRSVAETEQKSYDEVRRNLNDLNQTRPWKFDYMTHKVVFTQ